MYGDRPYTRTIELIIGNPGNALRHVDPGTMEAFVRATLAGKYGASVDRVVVRNSHSRSPIVVEGSFQ